MTVRAHHASADACGSFRAQKRTLAVRAVSLGDPIDASGVTAGATRHRTPSPAYISQSIRRIRVYVVRGELRAVHGQNPETRSGICALRLGTAFMSAVISVVGSRLVVRKASIRRITSCMATTQEIARANSGNQPLVDLMKRSRQPTYLGCNRESAVSDG